MDSHWQRWKKQLLTLSNSEKEMADKKEKRAYGMGTKRTNVTLSDSERQFLREVGGGNASNGIRVLIKKHHSSSKPS